MYYCCKVFVLQLSKLSEKEWGPIPFTHIRQDSTLQHKFSDITYWQKVTAKLATGN